MAPAMNLRVRGVTDHSIDLEWEGSVVLTDFLVTYTPNSPGGKCKDFEPSFNSSSGRNLEILKNASMCWILIVISNVCIVMCLEGLEIDMKIKHFQAVLWKYSLDSQTSFTPQSEIDWEQFPSVEICRINCNSFN